MWIFTRHGFFSIVRHNENPGDMMIRARVREDLEDAFGPRDIIENAGSDYRFRKAVPEDVVAKYLSDEVRDIDYETGVKHEISKNDPRRESMMLDIWMAHMRFQRDKYGEKMPWDDDEYEFVWKETIAIDN